MEYNKTNGQFVKMSTKQYVERVKSLYPHITPLDEYSGYNSPMHCKCDRGDDHYFITKSKNLTCGDGTKEKCPICTIQKRKDGLKGVITKTPKMIDTRPDLAEFLNNKNDAFLYGAKTNKKLEWKCPFCGHVFYRSGDSICRRGFRCPRCSSGGKSYPNRFMQEILSRLGIDFISEYSQPWSNRRLYDFYFEKDNKKYIVEMDGAFHYIDENQKLVDKEKDFLASQQNIHVIRIDCFYGNNDKFNYILQNILGSELNDILDFSYIDFEDCNRIVNMSFLGRLSELWDKYNDLNKVRDIIHLGRDITIKYLRLTESYGMSKFNYEDFKKIGKQNRAEGVRKARGVKIQCIETGEIFDTIADAERKYHTHGISNCINGLSIHSGKLSDGTKLTWRKVNKEILESA